MVIIWVLLFQGIGHQMAKLRQPGPQTAWKLAYPFLGNVIDYDIDINRHCIKIRRIIKNYGDNDIMEEIEAPLPVFISLNPSYNPFFNTVSQRLKLAHHQKEAQIKLYNYKEYLKIFNAQSLKVSPKSVGLPGFQLLSIRLKKYLEQKQLEKQKLLDGNDQEKIDQVVIKIYDILKLGEREGGAVVR